MRFLIIGDIVGKPGVDRLRKNLGEYIKNTKADVVIANGENSAAGKGIRDSEYKTLKSLGVDVITMGNHIYYRKEMAKEYINYKDLLIPANVNNLNANGYYIFEKNGFKIAVISLIGKVNMSEVGQEAISSPFEKANEIVKTLKEQNIDYIFLDFHAEATAEKIAMGYMLENDITCMFGTHTHVQTADEQILNTGMAYITDVGMTGPKGSVLGLKKDIAIKRFLTGEYSRYECSENEAIFSAIVVETDDVTKKAISIYRIRE